MSARALLQRLLSPGGISQKSARGGAKRAASSNSPEPQLNVPPCSTQDAQRGVNLRSQNRGNSADLRMDQDFPCWFDL